jgi:hypothetical protein
MFTGRGIAGSLSEVVTMATDWPMAWPDKHLLACVEVEQRFVFFRASESNVGNIADFAALSSISR